MVNPEIFCSWQKEINPDINQYRCPHNPTLPSCSFDESQIEYGERYCKKLLQLYIEDCPDFIPSEGLLKRLRGTGDIKDIDVDINQQS